MSNDRLADGTDHRRLLGCVTYRSHKKNRTDCQEPVVTWSCCNVSLGLAPDGSFPVCRGRWE
jgi:hypothetical protein